MQRSKNKEQEPPRPIFCRTCEYRGSLQKAVDIAECYGFTLVEPITITKRLPTGLPKFKKEALREKDFSDFPKEYMSTLKKYIDGEMHRFAQPIMLCHINKSESNSTEFRLEIIGTKKSVAEATVIRVAGVILDELGFKNIHIRLNSIGDKESGNVFLRELTNYYRQHISNLSPVLQSQIKKNILKIYSNTSEKYREINDNAPKPIQFLTEESRGHLSEILDFLENLGLKYEMGDELVGTSACFPKTLYEIIEDGNRKEKNILARGERYNHLAQKIGFNRKIPIVGISIPIQKRFLRKDRYLKEISIREPKIYFIHLGYDAKKRSLGILEVFRKTKVKVYQSLCSDSFASQLRMAEQTGVPYTIIMGQKEVMESSVIFRDMETRYQKNITLSRLENFLKDLKRKKVV